MLIDNFIKKIENNNAMTVKQLINRLQDLDFSPDLHFKLTQYDAVSYMKKTDDVNEKIDRLKNKFFIPYIIEKLLVYGGRNRVRKYKSQLGINDLYKAYNASGSLKLTDDFMSKVFYFIPYEQFSIQERNYFYFESYRLIRLYEDYPEVNDYLEETIGLELKKVIALIHLLMVNILYNKTIVQRLSKVDFIKLVNTQCKDISLRDIDNFFNFVTITREEFIDKYEKVRIVLDKNEEEHPLSYHKLQEIDRYLPKVSHQYPLIKVNEDTFILLNYTSLVQFTNLERIHYHIYEHSDIPLFKSKIHGLALNEYIKKFAKENTAAISVYGDEVYKPNKKLKYDAPDVIIEFEDYIIIVESKSKPFDFLKLMHTFDEKEIDRISEDGFKSARNIARYFEYINDFKGKKIIKFLTYFYQNETMLVAYDTKIRPIKKLLSEEILLVNLKALEYFLQIKSKPHPEIIEDYVNKRNSHNESSLYPYLSKTFPLEYRNSNVDKFFEEKIYKKYMNYRNNV